MERKLAAILAADAVGYSRHVEADEEAAIEGLRVHKEAICALVVSHHGRVFGGAGDSLVAEFASPVEAVRCAVEAQREIEKRNADLGEARRMRFRIGINLGDVIVEGENLLGDGVNVAARLEGLAEPGGICISRAVRDQIRDKLDLAMDDLGKVEVKNITRPLRVFRLVGDGETAPGKTKLRRPTRRRAAATLAVAFVLMALMAAVGWGGYLKFLAPADEALEDAAAGAPLAGPPVIAVLPFDNLSGDPTQDYFSDGITEDLITDLSRVSGLLVIARNSVFTYKGTSVNVQQVGRDLGVQYVLEGSVRKSGNQIRINAQLVDARTGRHLWADRFDRELTDIFALQDEVTQRIVSALAITLTTDEEERLSDAAKVDPEAYDMLLRGLERLRRFTREANAEAREFFERAIALDPNFARAYADVAFTYSLDARLGWTDNPDRVIAQALRVAQHALDLDEFVPQVHFALSNIYLDQGRHEDSIAAALRAVDIDPNFADGYAQAAFSLNYAGRPEEALEAMRKAKRLNPRPSFFYAMIEGHANFVMGRYEDAVPLLEGVVERNPQFLRGHRLLAAAYGQLGRTEDAEWEAAELLTLFPEFSLRHERQTAQYKNPADLERYIDGLRKAGLPE